MPAHQGTSGCLGSSKVIDMGLVYYKAIWERLSRRRRAVRQAALEAERILRGTPGGALSCESPGCGHSKIAHGGRADGTMGGCAVPGCRCTAYYLGPPT